MIGDAVPYHPPDGISRDLWLERACARMNRGAVKLSRSQACKLHVDKTRSHFCVWPLAADYLYSAMP